MSNDGFVSLKKHIKKIKLINFSAEPSLPVNLANRFSSLAGEQTETSTLDQEARFQLPPSPKIPPIMFRHKKKNYKSVVKELNKDYPNCNVKLFGEQLKILISNSNEHRAVTSYLDKNAEEALRDSCSRQTLSPPAQVNIHHFYTKGNTQPQLLTGLHVEKVAQLTKARNKFSLPIFMVELKKSNDSTDICYESLVL
ncbi:hypothetical protein TNIN_95311 [Trichonephila inaurata madagascariensis]|uniref:Pre-C2HC domain-containing protein n=1 Tax=Trichonephila inaurata madagascariensis TaxID=2747483 RepID=A0A8X6YYC1_9ARAC|nr:hypothetical protein TNIN_95311 [Trichonephila inaurata madagascariensis]